VKCPRCGSPNEPDDRFCSACGAALVASAPKRRRSSGERVKGLVGRTRRARLATAATALAIVAAIVAFIALEPAEEAIPRDAYTIAADRMCLQAKLEIIAAAKRYRSEAGGGDTQSFAQSLVPVVGGWRHRLRGLSIPSDRAAEAGRLEAALLEAEIRIAKLARVAGGGNEKAVLASARRADRASTTVEDAVSALGLDECAGVALGFSPNPR
jgi:hypothetical protein